MRNIFLAGSKGMVGSSVERLLSSKPDINLLSTSRDTLDLLEFNSVRSFFKNNDIDAVIIAAAKVGGIKANNDFPADFISENLTIQLNLIKSAHEFNVQNLIFLGSSCIYPKIAPQPMKEDYLLSGHLEPTNEAYAIAKIAGIKLCESYNRQFGRDYRSLMPTNLYGPGDNYHLENSHVIPALIRKFYEAKQKKINQVNVWGSGDAKREFLMVDDLAEAIYHVLKMSKEKYDEITLPQLSHLNVGSGKEISIKELSYTIAKIVKFDGEILFDSSQPDGSPRKLVNSNKLINTGWKPKYNLESGLKTALDDFIKNYVYLRK